MPPRSPSIWSALTATTLGVVWLLLLLTGCANAEGIQERAPVALVQSEVASPLDIKSLEARLRETTAIGALTKLKLKTQVDELIGQLRAHYDGQLLTSLTDLRRSYDSLVVKVLGLLQDGDPLLAKAITASRESIWGVLSSPSKFAAL